MTPRVVIADRSPFVRLAVRNELLRHAIEVVAEVDDAQDALRLVTAESPDAVLFDAELDEDLSVLAEMHRAAPDASLIVLSPDESESRALAAVRAGACGFLPMDTPPERLPAIVLGAVAGEAAIPRRVVRRLLEHVHGREGRRLTSAGGLAEPLTAREREVIELLAKGLSDRLVGERLGVSDVTVRRHAASAARKLQATRRDEAVAIFRRMVA